MVIPAKAGIQWNKTMKARVFVTLKNGVLDPQGKAIGHALNGLGFASVGDVRQGKVIDLELSETDATKAKTAAGYITFRVMSEKSAARSWIRPAQPGLFPLETAMEQAWDENVPYLEAALWEDIQVKWGVQSD